MTNDNPSSRGDYDLRADYTKKVSDKFHANSKGDNGRLKGNSEEASQSSVIKSLPSVCSFSACHLICREDKGTIDDHFFCVTHSRDFYFNRVALENGAKVSDLVTQGLGGDDEQL